MVMMTTEQISVPSVDLLTRGSSSMWYGEYGTAHGQDEESRRAAYRSLADNITRRHSENVHGRLQDAKSYMATIKRAVAMVKNDEVASVKSSKGDPGEQTRSGSPTPIDDSTESSFHRPSDVFRTVRNKKQEPPPKSSQVFSKSANFSKKNSSRVQLKLPVVKSKNDTVSHPSRCESSALGSIRSKTPLSSDLRSSSFLFPSLPSRQNQQPEPVIKHWRKRVTISWSEGCTSRVIIEEVHRANSRPNISRETKLCETREHLRRFVISNRR